MVDWNDRPVAKAALADPTTSADDLADIAGEQPSLWPDVAAHPNAYAALLDWLDAQGVPEVSAAVAARRRADEGRLEPSPATETVLMITGNTETTKYDPQDAFATAPYSYGGTPLTAASEGGHGATTKLASVENPFSDEDPDEPKSRKPLIIGLCVALGVVLLVAGALAYYFAVARPLSSAQETYDTAAANLQSAQDDLSESIDEANRISTSTSTLVPSDIRDSLSSSIETARPLLGKPPAQPTGSQELIDAAKDLDSRAEDVKRATTSLNAAIRNALDLVAKALTGVVETAQSVYDASAESLGEDDEHRAALKDALSVTCTQSDPVNKLTCSDKAADDILVQAHGILVAVVAQAQAMYDSTDGQLVDDAPRQALHAAIEQATCDQTDITEALACINAALVALPQAQKAVTKSLETQTYEYVITGPSCGQMGFDCGYPNNGKVESIDGWTAFAQAAFLWIRVSVTGDQVKAQVCGTQGVLLDVKNCSFNESGVDESWAWSGTRTGSEAIITPLDASGTNAPFVWATVKFAGSEAVSPATTVAFPQPCEKQDGTYGTYVADDGPPHCE
ncbi:MAG: hypothetical protein LBN10_10055 [Propionibacteriaceae bacterium]|jgi:hypothetical protein|nr:hypothetical protein [Propionibacteriaceae bacterium]